MKALLAALMLGNAAVFVFGALQHAGVSIGPLHEPTIVPASIVEVFCALALTGWSSAIKNANCRRSWPELAIVADCWRTTGKSEVIHFDEKRPNRTLVREKVLSGLIVQFADFSSK